MSVKVIKNRVFDGTNTYEVGDVIKGLSENDKSQLVSEGIVEYVHVIPALTPKMIADIIEADEPIADIVEEKENNIEEDAKEEQMIDPNSFALNADEYAPAVETKKKK